MQMILLMSLSRQMIDCKRRKRRITLSCSKKLSLLFHGITSKHTGNFYCLNCFDSFRTEEKLSLMKKIGKNKDFCEIAMPSEKNNIL